MAILKCKMCGGDLDIQPNASVGACQYCGAQQTLPRATDDQKANLFNRANHYRRGGEFDRAASAYENILNLDNGDAEAHWGLVLSRFGIEYVEDPATKERVPTCHRVHSQSILSDPDYLLALENAPDGQARAQYEREARRIAELQRGILAISAKEDPYDVFLCYKETSESGSRTRDSVLAQDVYYQLTRAGYKVFFARITLEDKLGRAYEPYIFAALHSARVMLVIGTKPEHFGAVWVKNEWSRYLALMKNDASKLLIPCYRDMDPYDLPEAMSMLQSQDMEKIGFMQDLLHGVEKVLRADEPKGPDRRDAGRRDAGPRETGTGAETNIAPLLKRAYIFLEDGDFGNADVYFERVLDSDPENAKAYIGKLMAELGVRREAEIRSQDRDISGSENYRRALRYADAQTQNVLRGYSQAVQKRLADNQKRLAEEKKEQIYSGAVSAMQSRQGAKQYQELARRFQSVAGYMDADARAAECQALAQKQHAAEADELRALNDEAIRLRQTVAQTAKYASFTKLSVGKIVLRYVVCFLASTFVGSFFAATFGGSTSAGMTVMFLPIAGTIFWVIMENRSKRNKAAAHASAVQRLKEIAYRIGQLQGSGLGRDVR